MITRRVTLVAAALGLFAAAGALAAEPESGEVRRTYWGPVPARADSVIVPIVQPPRTWWETGLLVPYHLAGFPFRVLDTVVQETVEGLDDLGFFALPPAPYPGLHLPPDLYLMPNFKVEGGEGFSVGGDLTAPDIAGPGSLAFLKGTRSTRGGTGLGGGVLAFPFPGWEFQTGGGRETSLVARYYGQGSWTTTGDLSYYRRRTTWGGVELFHPTGGALSYDFHLVFSRVEADPTRYHTDLALAVVHSDPVPEGFGSESNGWRVRLGMNRDTTGQTGRPQHGLFQTAAVGFFTATDGTDLRHLTYHLDTEAFIPLWHTQRTLAVRWFYNRIHNVSSGAVPFTRMVTFQRPDELRGFRSRRFYGLGAMGMTAEYRWPLWVARGRDDTGMDAYVFSDAGQVFDRTADIALENVRITGGIGLRLVDAKRNLAARVELGWSDEEPVWRLKFSQNFQYEKRGLVHGEDPTETR